MNWDLAVAATTFILIFPAELPDKTMVATLVLATRYRHLPVWLGVCAGFIIQMILAVTAGGLIALLPHRVVLAVTATLFAVGAVLLARGGLADSAAEKQAEGAEAQHILDKVTARESQSPQRAFLTSFVVIFTAEWGDLSQLFAAGMAARTHSGISVFFGASAALCIIGGLGVLAGRWLTARIPLWRLRLVSAALLALLCGWSVVELIHG